MKSKSFRASRLACPPPLLLLLLLLADSVRSLPATARNAPVLMIDAAPSVVSHQGAASARLIVAVGRSLRFVEAAPANATLEHRSANSLEERLELLTVRPIYVHRQ